MIRTLLSALEERLKDFDVIAKKADAEKRRKERLEFVNKSLNKALPSAASATKKPLKKSSYGYSESSSSSDSEDEPMMLRKCRAVSIFS